MATITISVSNLSAESSLLFIKHCETTRTISDPLFSFSFSVLLCLGGKGPRDRKAEQKGERVSKTGLCMVKGFSKYGDSGSWVQCSPPTRVYSSFLPSGLTAVALRHKKSLIARSLSPPFLHFPPVDDIWCCSSLMDYLERSIFVDFPIFRWRYGILT